jgi:hypothetical protein
MDLIFFENKKVQLLGVFLIVTLNTTFGKTQVDEYVCDSTAIATNLLGDNLYGQIGVDMHLQFPKGHNMADVFPKGKSFGVDVAIGKWFSPELGGRFKIKWNNGIFKNDHNSWLQPYGVPGGNHDKGGFMTFIWDIQFNLHNLLGKYEPERTWNLIASPRAGGWLDIGTGKGCPVLGVGVVNTYRLNDRWRLYADIGYNFVASINGVRSGKGHGSNGYAEINIGVEMDLSKKNSFYNAPKGMSTHDKAVVINPFWDNWFGQMGLGMSLQNPYGTNFSNVFPNGSTFGVNLGLGKWFTPEAGVRVGVNWQNGIIGNGHAHYLDRDSLPGSNKDKHGFISLYADFLLNLHNVILGYEVSRKWNTIIYPRMGLGVNFSSENKECPILGLGVEETYSISGNTKLYADFAYQVTTSGFHDGKYHTGNSAGLGHNGWFDINIGVQYEFGRNTWRKPGEKRQATHWEGGHNWPRFIFNTGASVVVAFGAKTALKAIVKEERPDHSDNQSFPSGHAAMAFAAARSIDKEFRKDCIWIPIAGYAAATAVGIERVANKRHHWYDVLAGAGVGLGAAELTWWLSDLCFGKGSNIAVGSSGNTVDVAVRW